MGLCWNYWEAAITPCSSKRLVFLSEAGQNYFKELIIQTLHRSDPQNPLAQTGIWDG